MSLTSDQQLIESALENACSSISAVSGGDIHRSYRVETVDGQAYFAKLNHSGAASVLASEYSSLTEFDRLSLSFFPKPIDFFSEPRGAVLLMRWHELRPISTSIASSLAQQLVAQHRICHTQYGWHEDNHIGLTPQPNKHSDSWLKFFRDQRLLTQLEWAIANGLPVELTEKIEQLAHQLDDFIDSSAIVPSLLHGDLWAGNAAFDQDSNTPLLFDPAPYYGDRETDLAMTELFGGFPQRFYDAYTEAWPLLDGYQQRKQIYNLYHALNHFNLFGAGYCSLIQECLRLVKR